MNKSNCNRPSLRSSSSSCTLAFSNASILLLTFSYITDGSGGIGSDFFFDLRPVWGLTPLAEVWFKLEFDGGGRVTTSDLGLEVVGGAGGAVAGAGVLGGCFLMDTGGCCGMGGKVVV